MPTETVYGLAAAINCPEGISRIFSTKKRPFFDPLIIHVASIEQAKSVTREWPPIADLLAKRFWPGPLTLVLPKADNINPMICSGLDTVGVRLPKHPLARRLIRQVGAPLAAPSANLFGKTSPTSAEHVIEEFDRSVFVVDGGPSEVGLESTVVEIRVGDEEDEIAILRPGLITRKDLAEAVSKQKRKTRITRENSSASPGHLTQHYMPRIPLVIVPPGFLPLTAVNLELIQQWLRFPVVKCEQLLLDGNPAFAARLLYARLRELSQSHSDFIVVEWQPEFDHEEWLAIWDRLRRAASVDLSRRH